MIKNKELDLAWNFVEKTDRNIFLTGKAGTGKTTFLRKIKNESRKRLVVVAPTGVAAINAKGVTIHSFFQMPFGPILPNSLLAQSKSNFQQKFNKRKIDIIRSLDLVIIDEISMVRADLLDGIDQVLRRYKDKTKVFGGVQILMIGDLQQLAPVVKQYEWDLLSPYYETAYFFSSKSFKEANTIGIELKHIYRQDNAVFIKILNEIRNNTLTKTSADILNQRYLPDFEPEEDEGYITLTTHNNRANTMNEVALKKITERSYFYKAEVKGKFPEHSYPTHEALELKLGAQVMFIKNDSSQEKRYFNGKIGKITHITRDEITVYSLGDDEEIVVTSEIWENITYAIDSQTKAITENRVGSFAQIPLKLAWAITIHKSQGLTFDKAIIDAQASFAHGQTYVALSRCRTLEGIVLKTPIKDSSIISDKQVTSFTKEVAEHLPNQQDFDASQKTYQLNLMADLFHYQKFLYPVSRLLDIYYNNKTSIKGDMSEPLQVIKDKGIVPLMKISSGFKGQLKEMSAEVLAPEKDEDIQERFVKAVHYFLKHTTDYIKSPLEQLTYATENKEVKKTIKKQLELLEDQLDYKLFTLNGLTAGFKTSVYLDLRAKAVFQKSKSPRPKRQHTTTTDHPELFAELRTFRSVLSSAEDIPPFQVFTQDTLYEMCSFFPTDLKQLKAINGMGKIRVKKYGEEIIGIIQEYVAKHKLSPRDVKEKKTKPQTGTSQLVSLELFKAGKSIKQIADERGFVQGTIFSHLAGFLKTKEVSITDLIPKKKFNALKKAVSAVEFDGISDLKAKIDDQFTYAELRIFLNDQASEKD